MPRPLKVHYKYLYCLAEVKVDHFACSQRLATSTLFRPHLHQFHIDARFEMEFSLRLYTHILNLYTIPYLIYILYYTCLPIY